MAMCGNRWDAPLISGGSFVLGDAMLAFPRIRGCSFVIRALGRVAVAGVCVVGGRFSANARVFHDLPTPRQECWLRVRVGRSRLAAALSFPGPALAIDRFRWRPRFISGFGELKPLRGGGIRPSSESIAPGNPPIGGNAGVAGIARIRYRIAAATSITGGLLGRARIRGSPPTLAGRIKETADAPRRPSVCGDYVSVG